MSFTLKHLHKGKSESPVMEGIIITPKILTKNTGSSGYSGSLSQEEKEVCI